MTRYNIINMTIEEVNRDLEAGNLEPKIIFTSTDRAEVAAKLENMSDDECSVEEYEENEDGDFVSGTDYDTPSNFIARYNRDK